MRRWVSHDRTDEAHPYRAQGLPLSDEHLRHLGVPEFGADGSDAAGREKQEAPPRRASSASVHIV